MRGLLIALVCLVGCGGDSGGEHPPISTGPTSATLPVAPSTGDATSTSTGDTSSTTTDEMTSTTDAELCPWDGMCASLVPYPEVCGDLWALECLDGWRCIDTVHKTGLVCPPWPESTGTGADSSTSSSNDDDTTTGDDSTTTGTDPDTRGG